MGVAAKGIPSSHQAARDETRLESDLGSARVTARETSVAKVSPFAAPGEVFF